MNEIFQDITQIIDDGLNSIFERPDLVIFNILAFIVLVLLVRKFLWQKVTVFLDEKQAAFTKAIDDADKERAHAKELQDNAVKEYERMKEETKQLKERLMQDAYKEQEALILSAKKEAKRRLEQAEQDIQFEIDKANEDIRQSIKEIAFTAAKRIVKKEIDEDIHQSIIDDVLKEREK